MVEGNFIHVNANVLEKFNEIERENKILLNKMQKILKGN